MVDMQVEFPEPSESAKQKPGALQNRPSVYVFNVGPSASLDSLEMRVGRFGEVVSVKFRDEEEEDSGINGVGRTLEIVYKKQAQALQCRDTLNTKLVGGSKVTTAFGPATARATKDHRHGVQVSRDPLTGEVFGLGRGKWQDRAQTRKYGHRVVEELREKQLKDIVWEGEEEDSRHAPLPTEFVFEPPTEAASVWTEDLAVEKKIEDFEALEQRFGLGNRYIILRSLPAHVKSTRDVERLVDDFVGRELTKVSMISAMDETIAHLTLNSVKAAAYLKRKLENTSMGDGDDALSGLKAEFGPPLFASPRLWVGLVPMKHVLEENLRNLLSSFGRISEFDVLPDYACAFVTFDSVDDAVAARNALYGYACHPQYRLNVDFTEVRAARREPVQLNPRPDYHRKSSWDRQRSWTNWTDYGQSDRRRRSRSRSRDRRRAFSGHDDREERDYDYSKAKGYIASAEFQTKQSFYNDRNVKSLYKMEEYVCNVKCHLASGPSGSALLGEEELEDIHIDYRTKIEHCAQHLEKARNAEGPQAWSLWYLMAARKEDCSGYDEICDYFHEKERVGFVQKNGYSIYLVPPVVRFLEACQLDTKKRALVAVQIPTDATSD